MAKSTNNKVIKVHEHKGKHAGKSQFDIWVNSSHVDINNIEGHVSIHCTDDSDFDEIIKQIKKYKI